MNPRVSVVIPMYNGARTIERCLDAVFASRCQDFEVIVVDDGSSDDSAARARRRGALVLHLPERRGAAAARNAGARAARGSVLFFTDADCLLEPLAMSLALARLRDRQDVAVGGTYTLAGCEAGFYSRFQSAFVHHFETRCAPEADYLATHALAICASTFRRHGGFAEGALPILEDVEFSHRLRRAGCCLVMEPAVQADHIFDFSLLRSLRNAYRKTRYWTRYSLAARDLLADSGTASRALKLDVTAWWLCATLLAAGAGGLAPGGTVLAAAALLQGANVLASRGLCGAFHCAHGWLFALRAMFYYQFVYPVAVGAGALAGAGDFGLRPQRQRAQA